MLAVAAKLKRGSLYHSQETQLEAPRRGFRWNVDARR